MPWSLIGGVIGGALIAGLLFFLLLRSRARKVLTYDDRFLIIPFPKAPGKEEGEDVFYILSEGRVVRVTPPKDGTVKS